VTVLPDPEDPEFLEAGHAALADRDPDRRALLLHASGGLRRRRVAMLRGLLRTSAVAPVPLTLPLAGLAASGSWFATLAERGLSAGEAHALAPAVATALPTFAVTSSVAGLDLPVVRLHHHVLSWLPGTSFTVALDGPPRVVTGRAERRQPVTGPVDLVTAGDDTLATSLGGVIEGLTVGERHELPADGTSPWWGRARAYEMCIVPRDVEGFVEQARGAGTSCSQCGDAAPSTCPFCRALEGKPA
jgi:hypothetical protein